MTSTQGLPKTSPKKRGPRKTVHLRVPLHSGQRAIKDHPARFRVVACGRQWGKTRLGCPYAFKRALEGKRVWWVAPDYPRAQIGWRILRGFAKQLPFAEVKEGERRIEFPGNGGFVEVKSAHGDDRLRGPTLDDVVIDEAAFMDEERWTKELRPTLSVRRGRALFLSSFRGKNWFYGLYERGRADSPEYMPGDPPAWKSWRHPSIDNPYIDAAEIEEARLELPEDVFRQEYEADPLVEAGAIFDRDWWAGTNRYRTDDPSRTLVGRWCSLDLSMKDKETNAYNALSVFELTADYYLDLRYAWRERLSFPKLMPRLSAFARQWNYDGKLRGFIVEDKAHGVTAIQTIAEGADDWLKDVLVPFDPGAVPKAQRWSQAAVWAGHGCIRLPHPSAETPWLLDYEEELYALPDASYKDWADTFAQGVIYLEHLVAEGHRARRSVGFAEGAPAL